MPKKPIEEPSEEPIEEPESLFLCIKCATAYNSIADTTCPNCGSEKVVRV